MTKMTHTAVISTISHSNANGRVLGKVALRELKNHFVDARGRKFSKDSGCETGTWSKSHLILETIKPIAA